MGKIQGYMYTSIYYCCKSFPLLLHDVMAGGWNRRPGAVDCPERKMCKRARPQTSRRPCSFKKKKKNVKKARNPPPKKKKTKSTASRRPRSPRDDVRRNTSHALVPYSPASIDPGCVETCLVQLSQSVLKTKNVARTQTD